MSEKSDIIVKHNDQTKGKQTKREQDSHPWCAMMLCHDVVPWWCTIHPFYLLFSISIVQCLIFSNFIFSFISIFLLFFLSFLFLFLLLFHLILILILPIDLIRIDCIAMQWSKGETNFRHLIAKTSINCVWKTKTERKNDWMNRRNEWMALHCIALHCIFAY